MTLDEQRPGYLRIAADLRSRILDGTYPPGSQLPTLPELERQYEVSLTTVRNALGVLRNEGLIESRTRAGHRVREQWPVQRLSPDRYRHSADLEGLAAGTDGSSDWLERHVQVRYVRTKASAELATLFGELQGHPLLARHYVNHEAGVPIELGTSYVRWSTVAGTSAADPINEPWPGGPVAQLASLGVMVARVEESLSAGMPTEDEAEALLIGAGVPVLRWTRRMLDQQGQAVEVGHPIVRRADRTIWETTVDLG
ncbi:GntR family transcriptional regulator [Streptacidiphilus sp. MAP5-3]|uniref:GntR family transcriptional regulator n=1 Tax=unclassified Streptacidiphilus TaxID=2643834 RepID=UPI003512853C